MAIRAKLRMKPCVSVCLMTLIALLIVTVAPITQVFAQDKNGINAVRFGLKGELTRFVIDTQQKINADVLLLGNPNRLVVDVPSGAWLSKSSVPTMGVVKQYRYGQFKPGVFRLVLDLNDSAIVDKVSYLPPAGRYGHRTIIDLKTVPYSQFEQKVAESRKKLAARTPKPQATIPTKRAKKRAANGQRIIVIDPGHGGHDPGSLGPNGVHEETVTLQIAKAIKRELEKDKRFKVYLTRSTDRFIELRQRFVIARNYNADLFISVHADSVESKRASGGTVYTLSETSSDRETSRLVARENAVDVLGGIDVAVQSKEVLPILLDLAMREKMNASAQFAEILLPEMRKTVNMRKHGHRSGPWLVLKDPIVPAILLETGFISNNKDAKFISSRSGQTKIAQAVRRATVIYFGKLAQNGR